MVVATSPPVIEVDRLDVRRGYSLEDYRRFEAESLERHEYRDGEVVTMTGGSEAHNTITVNLVVLLGFLLRDSPLRLYSSDLRLWLPQYNRATYPDVMVVEGEPVFQEQRSDEILNPTLIVEVLSPSTAAYDRGDKFRRYRSIPSFAEYLLVSQQEPYVEQFSRRDEGVWEFRALEGLEGAISLPRFDVELPLGEIYRRVRFAETG
ncbi:Uma2 family endonuclease [Geitlerinema sp. P-1104]|uniref:Uma2 family endonuclease n=1 Tax=Geitlerinema sp. P-1104 TaxID=2546230 RepID=UPI001476F132|nr:Uma2 family endonuclease [Geitlerinema sp. P-1104]NMG59348.1 Uma2 family endonuclease [Geitlerinema sp. P-1104]